MDTGSIPALDQAPLEAGCSYPHHLLGQGPLRT